MLPSSSQQAHPLHNAPSMQASTEHLHFAKLKPRSFPPCCRHILTVLRGLPRLTSLTVREEIPAGEEGSPCSHETCALTPTSCSALVHSLKHLVHLEWQGMLAAPHPSSLQVGALEQICRAVRGRAAGPCDGAARKAHLCLRCAFMLAFLHWLGFTRR